MFISSNEMTVSNREGKRETEGGWQEEKKKAKITFINHMVS